MSDKPSTTPFVFNREAVKAHLDKVVDHYNQFVGKKGHNVFFFMRDKVNPLIKRFQGYTTQDDKGNDVKVPGETTEELQKAILALPMDDKTTVVCKTTEPKQEPKAPQLITGGTGEVGLTTRLS